jgi:hypothetical protein
MYSSPVDFWSMKACPKCRLWSSSFPCLLLQKYLSPISNITGYILKDIIDAIQLKHCFSVWNCHWVIRWKNLNPSLILKFVTTLNHGMLRKIAICLSSKGCLESGFQLPVYSSEIFTLRKAICHIGNPWDYHIEESTQVEDCHLCLAFQSSLSRHEKYECRLGQSLPKYH